MRTFVFAFGLVLLSFLQPASAEEKADTPVISTSPVLNITKDDHVLGDAKAPVTIIEYSSLSCPHCAHFHNDILPELQKKYIDTGKVKLVFRSFPLNAPALNATLVLQCVPADKYYTFARVFYKLQEKWAFTENYLSDLKTIAKVGGMKDEDFDACVNDKSREEKVLADRMQLDKSLKIEATPTFYINGEKIQGAADIGQFTKVIDAKLSAPAATEKSDKDAAPAAPATPAAKAEKTGTTEKK